MSDERCTNKRRARRKSSLFFTRVVDEESADVLGYLVDITQEGLSLISEDLHSSGHEHTIRIECSEKMTQSPDVVLQARCVRCQPDINADYFNSGWTFSTDCSDHLTNLEKLLAMATF